MLSYPMQTQIFDGTINQSLNTYWLKYLVFKNKGRMIKVITNKTLKFYLYFYFLFFSTSRSLFLSNHSYSYLSILKFKYILGLNSRYVSLQCY